MFYVCKSFLLLLGAYIPEWLYILSVSYYCREIMSVERDFGHEFKDVLRLLRRKITLASKVYGI